MRTLLSVPVALLCLVLFSSCSSSKLTKADLASFKLRDITRFGQPHLVRVHPTEVQQMDQAELRSGQMASLDPKFQVPASYHAPASFDTPRLPNGRVAFDGSVLPSKQGGNSAVIQHAGFLPGERYGAPSYAAAHPQSFSIE